jgi:hypothetical protein
MDEQTRATAMTATEDAWDRLAALAFGDTVSAGGCSVHTHDCTCLAREHVSVGEELPTADEAAAPGVRPPPAQDPEPEPAPVPRWTPEGERPL